jgi:hypothetical protein
MGVEYKVYELSLSELLGASAKFVTPDCQAELCEERVDGIKEAYERNPRFFQHKTTLVFAAVVCTQLMYLVDGQHRLEFLKRHGDLVSPRTRFQVIVYNVRSDDEMRDLFSDLNRDSFKSRGFVGLGIDAQRHRENVVRLFREKYDKCFARTKKREERLYTLAGFVDALPEGLAALASEAVVAKVEQANHLFLQKLPIDEVYADERDCVIKGQVVFPLIFCNFLDFLEDPKVVPYYMGPRHRKAISKKLRVEVWEREFGKASASKCPVCSLSDVSLEDFECGHVQSHKNGGEETLANLRPICSNCNRKMGVQNWDEYVKTLKKPKKWTFSFPSIKL